ncbi:PHB depolymerase family esterase [Allosphingosinicella sp.]|uniref:extracellular catalytic domain type 1 short-chain-length polyhydroxyalkanoate depolymerase n=1 Tax=Allosphingosinicella sp. TaxID=2823234 RepID=UPI002ED7B3BF
MSRLPAGGEDRLADLGGIGSNPGKLRARYYVPEGLKPGAPLVVVLHGCTQNAAVYDHGSGWSRLADRHGFALLFPEQARSNNPNLCFNWFNPDDVTRGRGEAASIKAMIDRMIEAHGADPARIFVTGLSAGGAMAAAMLAAYPELFSAGAIIAGVPYGCASGVAEAFECMAGGGSGDARSLAANVHGASGHKGPWPRVQIWQGSADHTVAPSNADALVRQWTELHGLRAAPARTEESGGHRRSIWTGPEGKPLVEHHAIAGMGHGTPLDPGSGEGQSGEAGPHMLDVGVSSTDEIAAFFGIAPATAAAKSRKTAPAAAGPRPRRAAAPAAEGVQATIEKALRAAGLMR